VPASAPGAHAAEGLLHCVSCCTCSVCCITLVTLVPCAVLHLLHLFRVLCYTCYTCSVCCVQVLARSPAGSAWLEGVKVPDAVKHSCYVVGLVAKLHMRNLPQLSTYPRPKDGPLAMLPCGPTLDSTRGHSLCSQNTPATCCVHMCRSASITRLRDQYDASHWQGPLEAWVASDASAVIEHTKR
jgi:hypothetical protein